MGPCSLVPVVLQVSASLPGLRDQTNAKIQGCVRVGFSSMHEYFFSGARGLTHSYIQEVSSGRQTQQTPSRTACCIHTSSGFGGTLTFILSLLKYFLKHLEIEKFLPRSVILALNIRATVCQACSSRALCCLEGTLAFGSRRCILRPSLVERLGYRENCFPSTVGEVKCERRSGTIYWGKARRPSGTALDDIAVTGLSVHGLRYAIRLCFSQEFTEQSFGI